MDKAERDCHLLTPAQTLKAKRTSKDGLDDDAVARLQAQFGPNELPAEEGKSLFSLVLEQFEDTLVIILLVAAVISLAIGFTEDHPGKAWWYPFVEPGVILVILVINAVIGVMQELKAESAIEALKEFESKSAKVRRTSFDGHVREIASRDIVPGDIIEISVGDQIPCDIRITEILSTTLKVDQAILTGEADAVLKSIEALEPRADPHVIIDKKNIAFSGTNVTSGKARGVAVGTGSNTEIGAINEGLKDDDEKKSTPLQEQIEEFGDQLCTAIFWICVVVWVINFNHFNDPAFGGFFRGALYYLKIAVALAVAAIPEGLPAVVTICLALGTGRMAEKNALVRKLPSVETLGCTSVICSDKTGTLTTNQMSAAHFFVVEDGRSLRAFDVEGSTYAPEGALSEGGSEVGSDAFGRMPSVRALAKVCSLCNESAIDYSGGKYTRIGEPTEAALTVLVEKLNVGGDDIPSAPEQKKMFCNSRIQEVHEKNFTLEFSRDRKSMSVHVTSDEAADEMLVKGAPENILDRCDKVLYNGTGKAVKLTDALRQKIKRKFLEMGTGKQTLRCLGMATLKPEEAEWYRSEGRLEDSKRFVNYEQNMTFVGVVGMLDPPRMEVKDSIEKCNAAGIRVIVITGDNKETAIAICRRIGIFGEDEDTEGLAFTGNEFNNLSKGEQEAVVTRARLFARVEPTHKSNIVGILQDVHGEIAAMTGDGVNDAPALKKARIGVAMGTGTAVAKTASDMVLADDNFATIVAAVEEGRAIYANTKQFIRYLISSNIGEVVSIFLTSALGIPESLIPVQLLWVNLVTDGPPATALSFNPPDPDVMKRPPRNSQEKLIDAWLFIRYCVIGFYVGAATVAGAVWWFMYSEGGPKMQFGQLSSFQQCTPDSYESFMGTNDAFYSANPDYATSETACTVFKSDHPKTMALSILVMIELVNALNSISEDQSLLSMPPWVNLHLIGAIVFAFLAHLFILFTPGMPEIFHVLPHTEEEWYYVMYLSFPVVLIDEILKLISRIFSLGKKKLKSD